LEDSNQILQTVVLLNKAVKQHIDNSQSVQKEYQKTMANIPAQINDFSNALVTKIAEINSKAMREVLEKAQQEMQIATDNIQKLNKIIYYKPFIIHTALFITLSIFSIIFFFLQKKSLEELNLNNAEQIKYIQKYGKNMTINNCIINNQSYACVRIEPNTSNLISRNGETFAVVK